MCGNSNKGHWIKSRMKILNILTTVFLFASVLPAFAYPDEYQLLRWDKKNIKMSDVRFDPEFLMLSVPAEDSKGQTMTLTVQCGTIQIFTISNYLLQAQLKRRQWINNW